VLSNPPAFSSLCESTLKGAVRRHSRRACVSVKNDLVPVPFQDNLHKLPASKFLRCLFDLAVARACRTGREPNFEQFLISEFGRAAADSFFVPHNSKLWCTPLDRLDADWTVGSMKRIGVAGTIWRGLTCGARTSWGANASFTYPEKGGIGAVFDGLTRGMESRILLGRKCVRVALEARRVEFENGEPLEYDALIGTIPLTALVGLCGRDALRAEAADLVATGMRVIGFGIAGKCPSDAHWIYFPQPDVPFHRASYVSRYSAFNVPDAGHYSVLVECAYSAMRPLSGDDLKEALPAVLERLGLIGSGDSRRVESVFEMDVPCAYPVPTLGSRSKVGKMLETLRYEGVHSCGRFGAWRYERSDMGHCFEEGGAVAGEVLSAPA
jgi:protoporphyrinogen oxidase